MSKPSLSRPKAARRQRRGEFLTSDVAAIVAELRRFLNTRDAQDRAVGSAWGVYAFYDYDGEPIYVGQSYESLRQRIGRHLTNQRTDAVAMHVLDPMEVSEIEVWPLWGLEKADPKTRSALLNAHEYTVYQTLLKASPIGKMLNEKEPSPTTLVKLPPSYRGSIVSEEIRERLNHPDERIARRAATIANLAQVIRERDVSAGLRRTLLTQAERLQRLANGRLQEVVGETPPAELEAETQKAGPGE